MLVLVVDCQQVRRSKLDAARDELNVVADKPNCMD